MPDAGLVGAAPRADPQGRFALDRYVATRQVGRQRHALRLFRFRSLVIVALAERGERIRADVVVGSGLRRGELLESLFPQLELLWAELLRPTCRVTAHQRLELPGERRLLA